MKKAFIISFCLISTSTFSQSSAPDSTWQITREMIITNSGKPASEAIADLFSRLESNSGPGVSVNRDEFLKYLDLPESKIVYSKQLIKYATPLSREIQKKEHEDFTKIFMNEKRLNNGVDFIKQHYDLLSQAEEKYGVKIKDLVSILMWESGLGEFTGSYQVFNIFVGQILFLDEAQKYAIAELEKKGETNPLDDTAFAAKEKRRLDYRKKDAANSLVALLRYCKKYDMDPLKQTGSWGGAIGYVQFMPYNFQYIIDGDSDGNKDLFSWPDAVMSAANFLKTYGKYSTSAKKRWQAIYRYNTSDEYVNGVILYADEIWKRFKN